jgi:hypothetical protein
VGKWLYFAGFYYGICEGLQYWQGTARKQLREKIMRFMRERPGLFALAIPEARGVNVTATMQSIGIELEWPPRIIAYQVALLGKRREHD